jgi:hypothetical protein
MNDTLKNLKTQFARLWNENPFLTIVLGLATAKTGAELMRANNDRRNARSWERETKRRDRNRK